MSLIGCRNVVQEANDEQTFSFYVVSRKRKCIRKANKQKWQQVEKMDYQLTTFLNSEIDSGKRELKKIILKHLELIDIYN